MLNTYQVNPRRLDVARISIVRQIVAFSMVLFLFIQTADAQRAWGYICGAVQAPGSTLVSGNFYEFNLSDGSSTLLGSPNCSGAQPELYAGEFINGIFYALDNNFKSLVIIASNGNCSLVGPATGITANHTVSGLSHNPATGITYAMSTNVNETHLYTINISNGALTLLGSVAGVAGGISLMINDLGVAYIIDVLTDKIFPVNLATLVAGPGVALTDGVNPIYINFAQDADFSCGENGLIHGVLYSGGGNGQLGTLDPLTGVFIQTAFLGAEVCAFSVDCTDYSAAIPLSNWPIYIFIILMMTFIVIRYVRSS